MIRSQDIKSIYPETLVIASGVNTVITPLPGQIDVTIKYHSGGTAFISGSTFFYGPSIGFTAYGCSFATAQQYLLSAGEIFKFQGTGEFRLSISGATTTLYMARGVGAGFPQTT